MHLWSGDKGGEDSTCSEVLATHPNHWKLLNWPKATPKYNLLQKFKLFPPLGWNSTTFPSVPGHP